MRIIFLLLLAVNLCTAEGSRDAAKQLLSRGTSKTLSNGLSVFMLPRGTSPVFTAVLAVRVGGVDEVRPKTGISHMLEHMAFKGTKTLGTKDYQKERILLDELEEIAERSNFANEFSTKDRERWNEINSQLQEIWIPDALTTAFEERGASGLNATTDKEFTTYYVKLPKRYFEFWAQVETDRVLNPVMRQFYQEREVVREERRTRTDDSPTGRLYEQFLLKAFSKHPYRLPVIGFDKDILTLTARDMNEFHRRFYVPSNMALAIIGDVNEDDWEVIERSFGNIPSGKVQGEYIPKEPIQNSERRVSIKGSGTPIIFVGYKKEPYPHIDDVRLSLAGEILAGSTLSPLFIELVEKKGLASSISQSEGPGMLFPNLITFSITPKSGVSNKKVLDEFDRVIQEKLKEGFTEEELIIAKRSISRDLMDNMSDGTGLGRILTQAKLGFGNWDDLIVWIDKILATSKEEVTEAARKYLVNSSRTVGEIE
jgi:predicted Zn-dependent peptidase